jgi:hypothetical protein
MLEVVCHEASVSIVSFGVFYVLTTTYFYVTSTSVTELQDLLSRLPIHFHTIEILVLLRPAFLPYFVVLTVR